MLQNASAAISQRIHIVQPWKVTLIWNIKVFTMTACNFIAGPLNEARFSRIFEKTKTNTPAGSLLHSLVAIKDSFEQLCHEGFEVGVGRLAHHPVSVAAKCPACNGTNQSFLITQTLDQVGNQLRQVRNHALYTTYRGGENTKNSEREQEDNLTDNAI